MKSTAFWCAASLVLSLQAARANLALAAEKTEHVVVFHWNDLHGKIDALAKVARLAQEARRRERNVFLLAAGDSFTGNPYVDQYEPAGQPILELYNRIGVDVSALGNHEFDYGQNVLAAQMGKAHYRFVCANVESGKSGLPQPQPYLTLRTAAGTEIGVLGLIQVSAASGLPDSHPDNLRGLRFEDPIAAARRWVSLEDRYPELIALTHLGFEQDLLLAEALPQLDVIVGGHSHTVVRQPQAHQGVLVAQAGSNGAFLGRIDLDLEDGRVVSKKGSLIELKTISDEDATVRRLVDGFKDNPELNRVVADAKVALAGKDELGSLMSDAVRREMGLDIAFTNNGGIRIDELPVRVLLGTVYQLDPFGNQVVRFSLSPAEIRSLIRSSYERGKGIDLQAAGLQYTVIADGDGVVHDIELLDEGGTPLDATRDYRVGLSSYLASAYTFDHRDSGQSLFVTTATCLIRYLEKNPDLSRYKGVVRARALLEAKR